MEAARALRVQDTKLQRNAVEMNVSVAMLPATRVAKIIKFARCTTGESFVFKFSFTIPWVPKLDKPTACASTR